MRGSSTCDGRVEAHEEHVVGLSSGLHSKEVVLAFLNVLLQIRYGQNGLATFLLESAPVRVVLKLPWFLTSWLR